MVCETRLRVRYHETVEAGVVHYSYLCTWLDLAQQEMLRRAGHSYGEFGEQGYRLICGELQLSMKSGARFEEEVCVRSWVEEMKYFRFQVCYEVLGEDGRLIATARTSNVFVSGQMKPVNMAKKFPEIYEALKMFLA